MAISRNGWDVYSSGSNQNLVNFPWITGKVRGGDHYVVLDYIAKRWNAEVETIRKDWSWGYANRPVRGASVISEHATGTAVDFNAPLHPLGKKNTFSAADQAKIRQIMKDVSHAARWGGEWSRPDDMHVELIGGNALIGRVADQIRAGELPGLSVDVKPAGKPSKPATKPKPSGGKSGAWPEKPLKVTDKHTTESDAAWRELMAAIGYKDKDLGKNLLAWLSDLKDPRTGKGYYDLTKWVNDGVMGSEGVKALQRKLYDTEGDDGKRLYNGKADGKRQAMTVNAEIEYLNLKQNRGIK